MQNKSIYWHKNEIGSEYREQILNQTGLVLWFTGLSGSGKSTIAVEVEKELAKLGFSSYLLDGDNIRHDLNSDLGFSNSDRDENIRRLTEVAALMCDAKIITLVSAISPFTHMREKAREKINAVDSGKSDAFCEIYINTSVETCIARDTKGLYKKALDGEVKEFTGISSPYEKPLNPEIIINTEEENVELAVKKIMLFVLEHQLHYYLKRVVEHCVYTAIESGKIIMDIYNKDFAVEYKDDKSPLTEADKRANDFIVSSLNEKFPYFSVLSEESKDKDDMSRLQNDFCFIVDPLDGTKEFVKKNGEFTVNIALAYKKKPVMGVIYVPAQGKIYYAAKGRGAYMQNLNTNTILHFWDEKHQIRVSNKVTDLTIMKSRSHGDNTLEDMLKRNKHKIGREKEAGSSLKGCYIAEGAADVYYRFGLTCEWDTCAMHSIVLEAGGVFRQLDDTEMLYNRENNLNEKGFYILNREENKF